MNNQSFALMKMKNLASVVQKMNNLSSYFTKINNRSKTNPPAPSYSNEQQEKMQTKHVV